MNDPTDLYNQTELFMERLANTDTLLVPIEVFNESTIALCEETSDNKFQPYFLLITPTIFEKIKTEFPKPIQKIH